MERDTPFIVGSGFGYAIAITSGVLRLVHRQRRQQLWWDDVWAGLALLTAVYMLSFDIVKWSIDTDMSSVTFRGFMSWSCFWAQTTAIWSSRISIQATVVYFLPPGRNRSISKWAVGALALGWLASGISKLFYNGIPIPVVPTRPYSQLVTGVNMGLGIVATAWLIGWPGFIIMRMKLRRRVKKILMVSFGCAFIMLVTEVFHCVNLTISAFHLLKISAHLVLVASVVMGNIVILFASLYQHFNPTTNHRRESTTSGGSERVSGGRETRMSQVTSLVEPLTELNTSNMHWSEPPERSMLSQRIASGDASGTETRS
ncbi:hypothetical protein BKA70DRAFT_113550 [Coprinopsis sp. MPI-PUGE-AT-0042]|nr:hypothetical protein BKA70DRAFT_113550 [Coprinopsis sp. MPI-PUGE-AT-0042]